MSYPSMVASWVQAPLWLPDEIREVNEHLMRARWQLGTLLRKMARDGKTMLLTATQFTAELERIGLDRVVAMEAQRLSCMPKDELEKALVRNHKNCLTLGSH
jgi:hypothetical protein